MTASIIGLLLAAFASAPAQSITVTLVGTGVAMLHILEPHSVICSQLPLPWPQSRHRMFTNLGRDSARARLLRMDEPDE